MWGVLLVQAPPQLHTPRHTAVTSRGSCGPRRGGPASPAVPAGPRGSRSLSFSPFSLWVSVMKWETSEERKRARDGPVTAGSRPSTLSALPPAGPRVGTAGGAPKIPEIPPGTTVTWISRGPHTSRPDVAHCRKRLLVVSFPSSSPESSSSSRFLTGRLGPPSSSAGSSLDPRSVPRLSTRIPRPSPLVEPSRRCVAAF